MNCSNSYLSLLPLIPANVEDSFFFIKQETSITVTEKYVVNPYTKCDDSSPESNPLTLFGERLNKKASKVQSVCLISFLNYFIYRFNGSCSQVTFRKIIDH